MLSRSFTVRKCYLRYKGKENTSLDEESSLPTRMDKKYEVRLVIRYFIDEELFTIVTEIGRFNFKVQDFQFPPLDNNNIA